MRKKGQLPFGFASFAPQTDSGRTTWFYYPVDRSFENYFDHYLSVLPVSGLCRYRFDQETNRLYCCTNCNELKGYDSDKFTAYFVFQFDADVICTEKVLIEDKTESIKEWRLTVNIPQSTWR